MSIFPQSLEAKMETHPAPDERFVTNNAMLGTVVKVDGNRASVLEHVVDARASKFEDCPEVLAYLFWVRLPDSPRGQLSDTSPVSPNGNRKL